MIELLAWAPFRTPAPIWGLWWLLAVPLVIGIAVAYKATKVDRPGRLPLEVLKLAAYLLGLLVAAGLALAVLVEWVL